VSTICLAAPVAENPAYVRQLLEPGNAGCDLTKANLAGAHLDYLRDANLKDANLTANLEGADLAGYLKGANLTQVFASDASLNGYQPNRC